MAVTDIVTNVFNEILKEVGKTIGPKKRAVRRKRRTTAAQSTLQKIEKLLRPARQQTSRAKTTRTRATAQRRRVAAKTAKHRKSLRTGKARR
ncbi:MAG: hypothetical protein KF849_04320 [Rhizobiaceae bacterium]|nr:hypothetical protein [Rhizobiaceae bacterium]